MRNHTLTDIFVTFYQIPDVSLTYPDFTDSSKFSKLVLSAHVCQQQMTASRRKLIDGVKALRPTRHKTGHFGDLLPS